MKKALYFFGVLFFTAFNLSAQTDLIARIHFLGGDNISAAANSIYFTNEFSSPEALALESQTLDKLAVAPSDWFQQKLLPGTGDGSAQLRPLLDDFLKSEWIFEMRDATNGSLEYALAIRLNNDRARVWSKNLRTLLESWTKIPLQNGTGGWSLKKDQPPNLFQFRRQGDWVVLDCGQDELPLGAEIVESATQPTETNWLSANLDWPRLAQIFPALQALDIPRIELQVNAGSGSFVINGKLHLSQPLPPLETWRIPTNEIHQPFISFTAVRGLAQWLDGQHWFQLFKIQLQPDQFFAWAMPKISFQTYGAEPVPDADAALAQIKTNLDANTDWKRHFIPMKTVMNQGQISFQLPFVSPYIRGDHATGGDFISAGFFPSLPGSGPLPLQLMSQLDTPGIIYYQCEDTSARLRELPELSQLILLFSKRQQLNPGSAGAKWLKKIEPTPGDTVTEVVEIVPDEVTLVRTGPDGFTAFELIALANWMDSPDFPALKLPKSPL